MKHACLCVQNRQMSGLSNVNLPLRSNVPNQVSSDVSSHVTCIIFIGLYWSPDCSLAGGPQRPDASAPARVPQQPPSPAAAAATRAPAARHDDAHSGHQRAQRGRCSNAHAPGRHQPAPAPGRLAAVLLLGLQLRYRPAFTSSSSRLLQPLLLPSLPQPSAG